MRVLVTGAFGRIGRVLISELSSRGHRVLAFDLRSRKTRRIARRFADQVDVMWGDLRSQKDVEAAVAGQEAVIHAGAILAPVSESVPDLTHEVNVVGTSRILEEVAKSPYEPRLVFLSSVSVYGPTLDRDPPRSVDEPLRPTDAYTRSKVEAEQLLRESAADWVIMRVGACMSPGSPQGLSRETLRMMLSTDPANRVEMIHPADLASALATSLEVPGLRGRTLNLGGGPSCQITYLTLMNEQFGAAGLAPVPGSAFGDAPFYTDWLDTEEGQRLLRYQHHSFADFITETRSRLRWVRLAVSPFGRPATRALVAWARGG